jgi:hypothetical protein
MKPEMRRQRHIFKVRANHVEFRVDHRQENLVAYEFSGSIGPFAGLHASRRFASQNDPSLLGIHTAYCSHAQYTPRM